MAWYKALRNARVGQTRYAKGQVAEIDPSLLEGKDSFEACSAPVGSDSATVVAGKGKGKGKAGEADPGKQDDAKSTSPSTSPWSSGAKDV